MTLSPSTVANYQQLGAVVLRNVLTASEVTLLTEGISHNLAHLSPLAQVASKADDPGRFIEDFCTWQNNPAYAHILRASALPEVAKQLMQSTTARIYHDHL